MQWARAICRDDMAKLSAECLHRYYFVCAQHFLPSMMNATKSRLLDHAMPTVDTSLVNSTANDNEPASRINTVTRLEGNS